MKIYKDNCRNLIWFIFSVIVFFQFQICFSQNQLRGQVFSAKDSTGIYGASIYFDGTSIGASTNEEGFFKMVFEKSNASLIISSIGYETVLINPQHIRNSDNLLTVYLSEKSETLETVYLETDTWSRARKLELFKREFLGTHKYADLCEIINEDSIKLRYIASANTLIANAHEPLIIENKYLGYNLKYNLRDFQVKFGVIKKDSTIPIAVNYHGYSFFEPLNNVVSGKILKNRKKSYLGSILHFMRSLYSEKLDENNFRIYYKWTQVPSYKYFGISNYENMKQVKILVDDILIRYKFYNQSILFAKGEFTIDYSGHHDPPEAINLKGEMAKKRISELLPLDYIP
ncbi:carboxypeptidase-like regulatory domain-containing protein [Mariniflexile sp.]|uniref:carboxypeptidase-like regulatory domain-containing protein n=1 Tax=Mariniflexile sp. TaxID=1979402 RepID=UPI0035626A0C